MVTAPLPTLHFAPTPYTPEADFRYLNAVNHLTGTCDPGNAAEFFQPLIAWADAFTADETTTVLDLIIHLAFLSTPAEKYLGNLIHRLGRSRDEAGKEVRVTWHVDDDNDQLRRAAEQIREICDSPEWFVIETSGS